MTYDLLRLDKLPTAPTTIRFEFTEDPKIYWLVMGGDRPELCYYDPGREVDLVVAVDEQEYGKVLLGRARYDDAVRAGKIRLDGDPYLAKSFPGWLWESRFSKYAKTAEAA